MRATILCGLGLAAALTAANAQAPSPQALVRRAVTAMGGEPALRGLSSVALEFTAASFGLGQEEGPLAQARGTVSWGRIVTDWRGNRRFTSQEVRQPTGVIARQRQVVANGVGMNDNNGALSVMAPAGVAGVLQGMRLQPDRILLRALGDPAVISAIPPKIFRGDVMDGVRLAQGSDTLALYFDRLSGLLTVSDLVTDDPILGDRHTLTWYTRWQDAGGVKLPRQFDTEVNGRLLSHNSVTTLTANSLSDTLFAIPDSIVRRAQPASTAVPALVVNLVELAPGVWRAEGGTHHTLIVDQGARLVLVEAPQSRARTQAVLDTIKSRFPGKPIGLVVNTHHHWDHAGGLRAAMSAGHRIVTHQRNVAFVRGVGTATKTVARDALSRGRPLPLITPVRDSLVIGTGERRVVLYELPTVHVQGLLAAYVPSARVLFTADVVNPNPPAPPAVLTLPAAGSAELVALVKARGLGVDRYVGAHGIVVPWSDIERAAR